MHAHTQPNFGVVYVNLDFIIGKMFTMIVFFLAFLFFLKSYLDYSSVFILPAAATEHYTHLDVCHGAVFCSCFGGFHLSCGLLAVTLYVCVTTMISLNVFHLALPSICCDVRSIQEVPLRRAP